MEKWYTPFLGNGMNLCFKETRPLLHVSGERVSECSVFVSSSVLISGKLRMSFWRCVVYRSNAGRAEPVLWFHKVCSGVERAGLDFKTPAASHRHTLQTRPEVPTFHSCFLCSVTILYFIYWYFYKLNDWVKADKLKHLSHKYLSTFQKPDVVSHVCFCPHSKVIKAHVGLT